MDKRPAEEKEQTDFNSAIATLRRIDEIKKGLILTTVRENYKDQFLYLKAFFKELVSVMDDKDDEAQKKRFRQIRENYNQYLTALSSGDGRIKRSVIDSFDDWEIELKNIEQKYGMNMKKKSDPRFAMAGRG